MSGALLKLRVVSGFDKEYNVYMAQCLETGSIVTADDEESVQSMILELLEDEIKFAIKNRNIGNLFSHPAPFDVWERWFQALQRCKPEEIRHELQITAHELPHNLALANKPEVYVAPEAAC